MKAVLIDTSVVVGGHDPRDVHHKRAAALLGALNAAAAAGILRVVSADCVAVEAIGVLCRRRAERGGKMPLPDFRALYKPGHTARLYRLLDDAWDEVLGIVLSSDGRLNAHDALLVLYARRQGIPFIATFDADLATAGLRVLKSAEEVAALK